MARQRLRRKMAPSSMPWFFSILGCCNSHFRLSQGSNAPDARDVSQPSSRLKRRKPSWHNAVARWVSWRACSTGPACVSWNVSATCVLQHTDRRRRVGWPGAFHCEIFLQPTIARHPPRSRHCTRGWIDGIRALCRRMLASPSWG